MPKAVSATEAKNRLGALLGYVVDQHDEVIVENQGKPKAVLMSFTAFKEVEALRADKRRAEALANLRRLELRIADHNRGSDLTEEEAHALADAISHEIVDDLAGRGEVAFERDRR
jgi:prevent-host-death family protein